MSKFGKYEVDDGSKSLFESDPGWLQRGVLEGSVDVNDVVVKLKEESSAYKKVQIEQSGPQTAETIKIKERAHQEAISSQSLVLFFCISKNY